MKTRTQFVATLVVVILSSACTLRAQDAPPPPQPGDQGQADQGDDQSASFQTFYDQLGDQGTWVQTDDYGYVFQPNVTDPQWAPYTDGHWVYTDVGWTWVSDEPWGWATYHYGRWANIDGTGWVWIPGYQWAPAWVSWRYGGGYCGWAPLPPETFIGVEFGGNGGWSSFHFGGDVDVNFNIGAGCYNFVSVGDMGYPNYRGHYFERSRNYAIINNTTNITDINVTGGAARGRAGFRGVSVGGPSLAEVNAHSREHVATVQLTAANQAGRSSLQGNTLAVYAPRVNPASIHQARPANVARTIAHPTFNRGDSITKPLAVTSTVRPSAPSAEAIQAAKTAQQHAPASAKIATAKTTVKTPFTKPLTSLQPVDQTHKTTNAVSPAANSVNQHPSAASPFTGEPANQHSAASSPYTGEPANQHSAASSPYTGEPANKPETTYRPENTPASTYHPQTEEKPAQTYHPQSAQAPTYHPQAVEKPAETYHPQTEGKPAETYHPQTEEKPAAVYHPESAPAQTYHPQAVEKPAPVYHTESTPAPAYHPEPQATHEAPPQVHTQSAPAPASHPAPAPAAKPAPASNNANNQNQQNH